MNYLRRIERAIIKSQFELHQRGYFSLRDAPRAMRVFRLLFWSRTIIILAGLFAFAVSSMVLLATCVGAYVGVNTFSAHCYRGIYTDKTYVDTTGKLFLLALSAMASSALIAFSREMIGIGFFLVLTVLYARGNFIESGRTPALSEDIIEPSEALGRVFRPIRLLAMAWVFTCIGMILSAASTT